MIIVPTSTHCVFAVETIFTIGEFVITTQRTFRAHFI